MTYQELGELVKTKHPQYAGVDSAQLGQKVAAKYPQYAAKVTVSPAKAAPVNMNDTPFAYSGGGEATTLAEKTGLKALGNLPKSAFNLAKGLANVGISAVQNVIPGTQGKEQIARDLVGGVAGGYQMLGQKVGVNLGTSQIPKAEKIGQALSDRFGVTQAVRGDARGAVGALAKTATEDPFGFGADILGGGEFAATRAGARAGALTDTAARLTARPVINAATAVGRGAKSAVTGSAKYATAQATGLAPDTISEITSTPELFRKGTIDAASREDLATDILSKVERRIDDLEDLGSQYNPIRESAVTIEMPRANVIAALERNGLKVSSALDDAGKPVHKVIFGKESTPLAPTEIAKLERYLDTYFDSPYSSANAFLNARQAANKDFAKFEQGATGNLGRIGKEIYAEINKAADAQEAARPIRSLDAEYGPEAGFMRSVRRDLFNADGTPKDNFVSKIANLTGKGKEKALARMMEVDPTIEQRVRVLKAVEDIRAASGLKIGTYSRAGIGLGALSGNAIAIVAAILSAPDIAVPILRAFGYTKNKVAPIIDALERMANDVNNFTMPTAVAAYIEEYMKNPRMGLSIEDVTRRPGYKSPLIESTMNPATQPPTNSATNSANDVIAPNATTPAAPVKGTVPTAQLSVGPDGSGSKANLIGKNARTFRAADAKAAPDGNLKNIVAADFELSPTLMSLLDKKYFSGAEMGFRKLSRETGKTLAELVAEKHPDAMRWNYTKRAADEGISLRSALDYPALFEAYPEAKNIRLFVRYDPYDSTAASFGSTAKGTPYIRVNAGNASDVLESLKHEIQHFIQAKEGWPKGGSPEDIYGTSAQYLMFSKLRDNLFERANRGALESASIRDLMRINKLIENADSGKAASISDMFDMFGGQEGVDRFGSRLYRDLYGEAEARANGIPEGGTYVIKKRDGQMYRQ